MAIGDLRIRTMTRGELDTVIGWAGTEGWNPGLHDADTYYAADPDGFFIGLLDGEPIGSISAVKYSPEYVFMGFFIVKRELRGPSLLGPRLAEAAFAYAGSAIAGADGVIAQAGRYASLWNFQPAYHNMRYKGTAVASGDLDPRITPYSPADLDAVERYDRACFPAPRHAFLERWLQQRDAHALLYRDGEALGGYAMIRPAHDGYRIGPLFADDAIRANALFDALTSRVPAGSPVYLDIPQPNAGAVELVTRRRMTPMFETVRVYRGNAPQIDLARVFGVTTLELG